MDGYGSHQYGSHHHHHDHHGSNRHGSRDHEARRQEEHWAEAPSHQITMVHHFHHLHRNPLTGLEEEILYPKDRSDDYEAAYEQQRQRAEFYHADRDEYGERYYEERHRRRSDNRRARQAQHDHYLQGYKDGYEDSYEYSHRAIENQKRQHEQARQEDQRRHRKLFR